MAADLGEPGSVNGGLAKDGSTDAGLVRTSHHRPLHASIWSPPAISARGSGRRTRPHHAWICSPSASPYMDPRLNCRRGAPPSPLPAPRCRVLASPLAATATGHDVHAPAPPFARRHHPQFAMPCHPFPLTPLPTHLPSSSI